MVRTETEVVKGEITKIQESLKTSKVRIDVELLQREAVIKIIRDLRVVVGTCRGEVVILRRMLTAFWKKYPWKKLRV